MENQSEENHATENKPNETLFEPETKPIQDNKPVQENKDGEPAHYEVNVTHYANYDKGAEAETYSQEIQNNLAYASQTPLRRFIVDLICVLLHPTAFWQGQTTHPVTIGQMHFPHLTVLIVLRMIAVFTGGILLPNTTPSQVLLQSITQGILIVVSIWVFGLVISGIAALGGGGFHYDRGLRFSGYVMTPTLFVGIISIIPVPYLSTICDLLSMPWAFVVLGAGILPYLKIKSEHAPMITGLLCGLLLCLWGIMPMLIPFLMGLNLW